MNAKLKYSLIAVGSLLVIVAVFFAGLKVGYEGLIYDIGAMQKAGSIQVDDNVVYCANENVMGQFCYKIMKNIVEEQQNETYFNGQADVVLNLSMSKEQLLMLQVECQTSGQDLFSECMNNFNNTVYCSDMRLVIKNSCVKMVDVISKYNGGLQ
jgi:hypothetical protein